MQKKGMVMSRLDERLYMVETPNRGMYRRNCYHLKMREKPDVTETPDMTPVESPENNPHKKHGAENKLQCLVASWVSFLEFLVAHPKKK